MSSLPTISLPLPAYGPPDGFNLPLERDIFRSSNKTTVKTTNKPTHCAICGTTFAVQNCHIIQPWDIHTWDDLKDKNYIPYESKSIEEEVRNTISMCSAHVTSFERCYFFIRYLPQLRQYVFINYSGVNDPMLTPFHGKSILLDVENLHTPFPALFLIHEQRVRGFWPFANEPLEIPPLIVQTQIYTNSPELVCLEATNLLRQLASHTFDEISDKIVEIINGSAREKDARTLKRIIIIVYEQAMVCDATQSELFARLCHTIMEEIRNDIQDGVSYLDREPITGGLLFRKYLLNRCQEDLERGWDTNETLGTEEYEVIKRRGLALIRLMGELFKLQILSERSIHKSLQVLLGNANVENYIEDVCTLLLIVGRELDTPKAQMYMDVYFAHMKEYSTSPKVAPRVRKMLQDIIGLRNAGWVMYKEPGMFYSLTNGELSRPDASPCRLKNLVGFD